MPFHFRGGRLRGGAGTWIPAAVIFGDETVLPLILRQGFCTAKHFVDGYFSKHHTALPGADAALRESETRMNPENLPLRRLLLLVLVGALIVVLAVPLWHLAAGYLDGGLTCANPDVNCGPG
jgi:hypothetical protein